MNNLIPVRRTDKNGVLTTKWVTPPSEVPSRHGGLPAPSLASSRPDQKIYSPKYGCEMDVQQGEVARLYRGSMIRHEVSHRVDDLDPQVVQALEYLIDDAESRGVIDHAESEVKTAFNIVRSYIQRDRENPYVALDNLAVFGDAVMQRESKNFDVPALVAGIKPFFGTKDFLLNASDDERERATALVTATARIKEPFVTVDGDYYSNARTISLRSQELSDFIMSRPDDAPEIARIVNERNTDDVDTIREVLSYGKHALRDGTL